MSPGALDTRSATLACTAVTKSFGGVHALRGVDLTVSPGRTLAVIGPNGAGKSSLINVLTGLYRASSGRVTLDDEDISTTSLVDRARRGVLRTFQGNRSFASMRTVGALALGLEAPRARQSDATPEGLADDFGLTGYLGTKVADLPYGVQKVLNLALVSASRPRVLLLDEPFAGVHAADVSRLSSVITTFRDRGVAVAVVEHNIEALLRIADDVIVLDSGTLIFAGDPGEARTSPVVREAYLGPGAVAEFGGRG